jgi:hypothetical protein
MKIRNEDTQAIRQFGYTEREARFLCVVAIHAGYFSQNHVRQFSGNRSGRTVSAFIKRSLSHGHLKESKHQNNARVYQLTYKPLYAAIGKENLRNRRIHSFDYIKTKLACLDFILGHFDFDYFEGEADKVQYFEERFQISPQEMPGKTYKGANRVPDTIRYFVDKFPMFLDTARQPEPFATLTYIDPGTGRLTDFQTHLETYSSFLKRLPRFGFIYAGPNTVVCGKAEKVFKRALETPVEQLSSELVRYFVLRTVWDAKQYASLSNTDMEFLNHARQCFAGEPFESSYKKWQSGSVNEKQLVAEIENHSSSKQEILFRTCLLPRDYSSFGQNSKVTRKAP